MSETQKWQNISAGPRQVKDLNKAISTLRAEGQTHDELTGVVGGDEHRSSYMVMFSGVRPEVTALDEDIRAKYGHEITKANVRAIIGDYEAALPEARKSRPTDDKRRTPEDDTALRMKMAERDAADQARRDAADAMLAQVLAEAPRGAKALIIAEYHEDASDPQSDYSNTRTTRTVAIGFRLSSREDFRALRDAAALFPETAHLASEDALTAWQAAQGRHVNTRDDLEHRDNHSMGPGNYLSDHGWAGSGTGWLVKSRDFPCKWVDLTEDAIPERASAPATVPAPDMSGGAVTISPDSTGRPGIIEIRFADKPLLEVRKALKGHHFGWAGRDGCWRGRDVAFAESLAASTNSEETS